MTTHHRKLMVFWPCCNLHVGTPCLHRWDPLVSIDGIRLSPLMGPPIPIGASSCPAPAQHPLLGIGLLRWVLGQGSGLSNAPIAGAILQGLFHPSLSINERARRGSQSQLRSWLVANSNDGAIGIRPKRQREHDHLLGHDASTLDANYDASTWRRQ